MTRWTLVLLLLVSACASQPSQSPPSETSSPLVISSPLPPSPAPAPPSAAQAQSFTAFVASVRSAKYSDYAAPKSKVESEAAFEGMRGYLLSRYENAKVPRSYLEGSTVYDCLPSTAPATGSQCPSGHAPQRRLTLADLTRFPNLAAYLGRPPGGGRIPPTPPPT